MKRYLPFNVLFPLIALCCCFVVVFATAGAAENDQKAQDHLLAGKAYLDKGDIEKARQEFEEAASLDSSLAAEAHFNLGMAYSVKNQPTEAIASLEKAVALKPDEVIIRFNLANAYNSIGKKKQGHRTIQ